MNKINESLFNTPASRRALKLHEGRIRAAIDVRSKKGLETNFERQLATAQCLENTRQQIRALEAYAPSNATQPSSVGQ